MRHFLAMKLQEKQKSETEEAIYIYLYIAYIYYIYTGCTSRNATTLTPYNLEHFLSERLVQYIRLKIIIHCIILQNIYEIHLRLFEIMLLIFDVPFSCRKTARKNKRVKLKMSILNNHLVLTINILSEFTISQTNSLLNMSTTCFNDCINTRRPLIDGWINQCLGCLRPAAKIHFFQMFNVTDRFTIDQLLKTTPDRIVNRV